MKRLVFFFLLTITVLQSWSQVRVTASAPGEVINGDQFKLSYTVNTQDVSDFKIPSIQDFDVLYGPSRSEESSVQIINGKVTSNSSITFTYVLSTQKAGSFTLPVATVTVNGKNYRSNTLKIKVLPGGGGTSGQGGAQQGNAAANRMHTQDAGSKITGKDLFITVTASKQRVYEQEAVLLTYKVYSLVSLTQLMGDMPDLDGFHTQEIQLSQEKSMKLENYNGRNYGTVVWRQYVLFPQQTGKLTIPSIKFEGIVVQQNRNIDPFDAFFNGGSSMVEVKKTIVAPSITLQVDALPQRPTNFSGAVGRFNVSSSISPQSLKANEALTLRTVVSGSGNMKLIKAPTVSFPKDFEVYDPKVTDKTSIAKSGVSGNKVFDYVAIPRHGGKYQIPATEFCYFDLDSRQYKTLRTEAYEVEVAKGSGRSRHNVDDTDKEDLQLLGSDIRFIKTGDVEFINNNETFFGTTGYAVSYLVPFVLFVVLVIIFRKKAIENANMAKIRGKKASKVAVKRLKKANQLLKSGEKASFYDEVMRALWGYVGDKLNIPVAELSKDNVQEKLVARGADEALTQAFLEALNECEFARFAPGNPEAAMDNMYTKASQVIGKMENTIK